MCSATATEAHVTRSYSRWSSTVGHVESREVEERERRFEDVNLLMGVGDQFGS